MPHLVFIATTPRDWSEPELLRRVLGHDSRAWSELVRRYRPVIFRCITRILGRGCFSSPTDADEVYAEVLMSLVRHDMRKLRLYDPARGAKLGSWIGLLSKNATHDYIRSHSGKPQAAPMDQDLDIDSERESPLDDMLRSERRTRLEALLAEYSDKDREFFALYFGRGMTVEEVAEEMGISVKTVYTKKHKLLTRLATTVAHAA